MRSRNQKIGLTLFAVYLLFYGGFVLLSAFSPETMESRPAFGVNLAILYGFGLILLAFVLSLLYGILCTKEEDADVKVSATGDAHASEAGEAQ